VARDDGVVDIGRPLLGSRRLGQGEDAL